jgi:predicted PurR-regulated permease PerM
MAKNSSAIGSYRPFLMLGCLVLVAATLYWAQKVIIPLTLAVLLTFVLTPLVALLQRRGLPPVPAVLLVVLLALVVVAGVGSGLTLQAKRLAGELPQYKDNIARKVAGVRGLGDSGWLRNVRETFRAVTGEIKPAVAPLREEPSSELGPSAARPTVAAVPEPVPVRLESSSLPDFEQLLGPAAESLAAAGLVVVLVTFMLIQRQDLRNRLMRLVPQGRLLLTTRAVAEAADRLSRFLLMQLAVNAGYGLVLGTGLALIGLPYALVWGILAAFLRYLPFVGTGLSMVLVILFGVAVFPGWTQPLLILALFVTVELIAANVVEPLLFGHSTGISPLALLIALAFWTWLWGPIGLVLSTPLTVCLMVLGRHVPGLEFLGVLLGDEPALDPEINFYQRLLAGDQDEATDLVVQFVDTHPPGTVYDRVLLPALGLARGDRASDELAPETERFIWSATRDILEYLAAIQQRDTAAAEEVPPVKGSLSPGGATVVFGCPARDEVDELTLRMLEQMLEPSACRFEVLPAGTAPAAVAALVQKEKPAVLCVAALPPGGLAQALYLCKRLRARFPGVKLVVGLWGVSEKRDGLTERLVTSGADQVAWTLSEARDQIVAMLNGSKPRADPGAPAADSESPGPAASVPADDSGKAELKPGIRATAERPVLT